jgi:hypothetical protein
MSTANAKLNVLVQLNSNVVGMNRAIKSIGNLVKGLGAAAVAYVSYRTVVGGAKETMNLAADLQHLSQRTSIANYFVYLPRINSS